jgi:hypothetical protein
MSYIGNEPTSVAFLTDTFSGNGSTTAFTLSAAPATTSSILVAITGVLQDPSTYSVSGTTLTFSPAPPTGTSNISVRFLGIPASGVTTTAYRTVTEFTATAGQTSFSVPSYTVGFIDVYRNGVMLGSADYTATDGLTVVLTAGATAGDLVEVISFQVSSVLNAIPASPSSVGTSYLVDGSVTAAKLASGAALSNLGTSQLADANMAPGSVLQVVTDTQPGEQSTTSTSFVDTALSVTITPISATSRIFLLYTGSAGNDGTQESYLTFVRNSTNLGSGTSGLMRIWFANSTSYHFSGMSMSLLDSPATTSATTYKVQFRTNAGIAYISGGNATDSLTVFEIAG